MSSFQQVKNSEAENLRNCINALVKLFWPHTPGQPRGQKKNVCDKKGRSTGKWSEKRAGHWKKCLIRARWGRKKVIRRQGQLKKSVVPGDGGRAIWQAHKLYYHIPKRWSHSCKGNNWVGFSKFQIGDKSNKLVDMCIKNSLQNDHLGNFRKSTLRWCRYS